MTAMNRMSRNVVSASTVYEPPKAVASVAADDERDEGRQAEADERGRRSPGR